MTDTQTAETAAREETVDPTAEDATNLGAPAERAATATATATATPPGTSDGHAGGETALFDPAAARDFQTRWQTIQVAFVDEPKGAVQQADQLVEEVLSGLQASFSRERKALEQAWSGGNEASTEDLRQAIRRYRSFFNRLLNI